MALTRFVVDAADVARVPELTSACPSPVGLLITGGDPITLLAAYGPDWPGSWGLWMTTSAAYPPQLLARDVKTLSHLMSLDHLVVRTNGASPPPWPPRPWCAPCSTGDR